MKCATCGAEYKVIRDQDDNPVRHLCACEAAQLCHQCKRGKVNHAQLTRTGEVANYACARHGSPDAVNWLRPIDSKPSAGRVAAEAMLDGKLKAAGKTAPKGSELVPAKPPAKNPYGRIKEKLTLYLGRCEKCARSLLTTLPSPYCPSCGVLMDVADGESGASVDGIYVDTGPRGTSVIITAMVESAEPYDVRDVHVVIPGS